MQAIVDSARVPLGDPDKTRHSDAELLRYLNQGVHRAYELRPDLKFGSYGTLYTDLALAGTFPLPARYERTLEDYVIARAEMEADEAVNTGRAKLAADLFVRELLG